jgi:hypothetical protein
MKIVFAVFIALALVVAADVEVNSLTCTYAKIDGKRLYTCVATFTGPVPADTTLTAVVGSDTENPTRTISVPVPSGSSRITFDTGSEQALKARLPGQD